MRVRESIGWREQTVTRTHKKERPEEKEEEKEKQEEEEEEKGEEEEKERERERQKERERLSVRAGAEYGDAKKGAERDEESLGAAGRYREEHVGGNARK